MTVMYYALYKSDGGWKHGDSPTGIIVTSRIYSPGDDHSTFHAMLWNHRENAWQYDPERSGGVLNSETYADRIRRIDRTEAEQVTPSIANQTPLPDEDTIAWIFQWRGNPPQHE